MKREKKDLPKKFQKETKHFLQPLALVLISIVFILLILVSGIMDLRRIDRTLIGFMEDRGVDIIASIQRVAQGNYTNLIQLLGGDHTNDAISPFSEETFLPQETLIQSLVNLSKRIDQIWESGRLSNEERIKLAYQEGLSLIAIFDIHGRITFQSGFANQSILNRAAPVVAGQKDISIELFNKPATSERIGFIAVRRSSGEGTILIGLDQAGFRFWGTRVAIQRAIDETGWSKDVVYISVMNKQRQVLGHAGYVDEQWKDEAARDLTARRDSLAVAHRKINYYGRNILEIMGPVFIGQDVLGIARIGLERDHVDQILREHRNNMFISMAAIMLIGVLSIWFLFYNQNRHLKRIEEMGKRLQQSERLSSLGQLAAGVAHEIRNPLNAISMASQRMQREYVPLLDQSKGEEFKGLTGVVRDEIRRLNAIIEEFLNFSRTHRLELKDYPVEDVLQKLVNLVEEEATAKGISIKREWDSYRSIIPMDIDKLQQAFLNIIKNGIESISNEGSIAIGVDRTDSKAVLVRIADTGAGLRPEEIDRIFNPEYTTKEKGLGLGLSISHEIIRAHGGEIRVRSEVGVGSTFEIRLPMKA